MLQGLTVLRARDGTQGKLLTIGLECVPQRHRDKGRDGNGLYGGQRQHGISRCVYGVTPGKDDSKYYRKTRRLIEYQWSR